MNQSLEDTLPGGYNTREQRVTPAEGPPMDSDKRIEELESQVRQVMHQVHALRADEQDAPSPQDTPKPDQPAPENSQSENAEILTDVRTRINKAIGNNGPDTLETRIGAVWLSRLAAVVTMTFLALAANWTIDAEILPPIQKIACGYTLALVFIGYYAFFAKDLYAQAILGCGLATLYYTTYATFYIDQVKIDVEPLWGLPPLLLCFTIMFFVAHKTKSQTVAGIAFFLTYYTVIVSCTQAPTIANLSHALLTCTALAIATLIFHTIHRWILFTWVALIATQITYFRFLLDKPEGLAIPDTTYFWIANGFLTLFYILFSLTCIVDARKIQEYRKGVASMAGVNSFVYFALTWFAIRNNYVDQEWIFRLSFAGMLLAFALFAQASGPRRNYLYQIFIAKTVVMLTLALQAFFAGEKLLVAFAIECLGLAFSYRRSGLVTFKALGLALAIITFVWSMISVKIAGDVYLGFATVPANWFGTIGVAFSFSIVAWFYEKFVPRFPPQDRTVKGQWFLADTILDLSPPTMSLLHAASAALLLLAFTIFEWGYDAPLPYILFLESFVVAAWGLLLFTPQIDIASVLLLVAAHVSYYVLLFLPFEGFEEQPNYALYTALLAVFTYGGAHAWERYLKRFFSDPKMRRFRAHIPEWEHHLVAALPYVAGTAMLITLISRQLDVLYVPPALGALAMALLMVGSITRYTGVKASGVIAMASAVAFFYISLYNIQGSVALRSDFLLYFALFLSTFVGAERLFAILQRYETIPSKFEDGLRSLFIALAVILGIAGLSEWSPQDFLTLYLLAVTVIALVLGVLFRESRYRWGGLVLIVVLIVRAFALIRVLSAGQLVLIFGAAAIVLLIVSKIYARLSKSANKVHQDDDSKADTTDVG